MLLLLAFQMPPELKIKERGGKAAFTGTRSVSGVVPSDLYVPVVIVSLYFLVFFLFFLLITMILPARYYSHSTDEDTEAGGAETRILTSISSCERSKSSFEWKDRWS